MGYDSIAAKLADGEVVVLDGGIGTEVLNRTDRWVRNGIESSPDVIQQIHADYIAAGADVITTNTFQISRHTFVNFFHGLEHMSAIGAPGLENRAAALAQVAANLAATARQETGAEDRVAVAGSMSPLNHPYRSDLAPDPGEAEEEHGETAEALKEAGVDLILLETMNTLAEARAALAAAKGTGLPVWVSLVPNGRAQTLGGDSLDDAATELAALEPDAILLNCAPAAHIGPGLQAMAGAVDRSLGGYALIGRYAPPSWKMDFFPRFVDTEQTPPDAYVEHARSWVDSGARIVGGCCGTTPKHIEALNAALGNAKEN